jgi:RNA polymerase sigma factor (sigma-70 family)
MEPTGDVTRAIFREMQSGNREAFDRFFERNTPRVLVYINFNMGPRLRRVLEPTDILQNLYLNLFKSFESFSDRAQERGIHKSLIRMADHEITEAYRYHFKVDKRNARREVAAAYLGEREGEEASPLDWVPSTSASVSQRVIRQEEYQRILRMLRELTPIEQYVTVCRVIEGISAQEIADLLGKTRGAVQMIISRVRDKLRKRADQDHECQKD